MAEEIHKSHRARMRERFLEHGLDNFADHEVLELLLYYAIPRGDVNPLAHRLLDEFGTLAGVLEATSADLRRVDGVGDAAATLLHMIPATFQRYQLSKFHGTHLDCSEAIASYLISYFADKPREQAVLVLLDNGSRLIRVCEIGAGSPTTVKVNYRLAVQVVLQYNAANVILSHNHPRGECRPSRADISITSQLRELMKKIDVRLIDHIIVAEDEWMSLAQGKIMMF